MATQSNRRFREILIAAFKRKTFFMLGEKPGDKRMSKKYG